MTNPLTDVLPTNVRKILYAIFFVAFLLFTAWQAAAGDLALFVGGALATLVPLLAGSNVQDNA